MEKVPATKNGEAGIYPDLVAGTFSQPAVAMDGTAGVKHSLSPQWPWMALRAGSIPSARSGHGWHCGREYRAGEGTRTLDIQLGKQRARSSKSSK